MKSDDRARLSLLALIEGNSRFWCGELARHGAEGLLQRILDQAYQDGKHGADRIQAMARKISFEQLRESLGEYHLITPLQSDWPEALNQLLAPPFALIAKGNRLALNNLTRSISIVGSRNPTSYGSRVASELASSLADRDYLVISGGALGIDSDAHRGALAADGITVAVLGGGVSDIYPASNGRLFDAICAEGVLLSEVLPEVHALPHRFLIRNRIIAALGLGTIVVEAALRSGSIRTARDAGELFRPVMAIPGPITSPTSAGCHALITERKAELVTCAQEVVQLIEPL